MKNNYIERVIITGLAEYYNFDIEFDKPDAFEILIGLNNSSRFDICNILYMICQKDFKGLFNVQFNRAEVLLNSHIIRITKYDVTDYNSESWTEYNEKHILLKIDIDGKYFNLRNDINKEEYEEFISDVNNLYSVKSYIFNFLNIRKGYYTKVLKKYKESSDYQEKCDLFLKLLNQIIDYHKFYIKDNNLYFDNISTILDSNIVSRGEDTVISNLLFIIFECEAESVCFVCNENYSLCGNLYMRLFAELKDITEKNKIQFITTDDSALSQVLFRENVISLSK